jgi:hypothetical protein
MIMTGQDPGYVSAALHEIGRSSGWKIDDIVHGLYRRGVLPSAPLAPSEVTAGNLGEYVDYLSRCCALPSSSHTELSDDDLEDYIEDAFGELRKAVWHGREWLAADLVAGIRQRIPAMAAYAGEFFLAQARATAWTDREIAAVRQSLN